MADDPGACDIWVSSGDDANKYGTTVYCRNHSVFFNVPNCCPGGRAYLAEQEAKKAAEEAKVETSTPIVWREFI